MSKDLDFIHVFLPMQPEKPVLLLLHGTGGDEQDLIGLAQEVYPEASILSVRGKVLENGMPRFFKRLAEGVFDMEDLKFRTTELAEFICYARVHYNIESQPIVALGYSNGANIAGNILLQYPDVLDGAILLRAMVTAVPEVLPDLSGKKILILSGLMDPIIPIDNSRQLAGMFEQAHADLTFMPKPVTHGLSHSDITDMTAWIKQNYNA